MQLMQLHHFTMKKTMQLNQLHNFHIFYYETFFITKCKIRYFLQFWNVVQFINMFCYVIIMGLWWQYNGRNDRHFFTRQEPMKFNDLWTLANMATGKKPGKGR